MRRLTSFEYRSTVHDILEVELDESFALLPDDASGGFASNATLPVSLGHLEAYMNAAEAIAPELDIEALAPCLTDADDCARDTIERFGRRMFRRSLGTAELDGFSALYLSATEGGRSAPEALRLVFEAFLQSPSFLYRPEIGEGAQPGAVELTDLELASRLSFFLWGSTPDELLLDAAESGTLKDPKELRAQAERLLSSPKAARTFQNFFTQWLGLEQFDNESKDPGLYPEFSPSMRRAMVEESQRFIERVMASANPSLAELFSETSTVINNPLAELYGVEPRGESDNDWFEARLPADERAGLLTQASFLASHSNADQQSPILRGYFVRTRILCGSVPPPPPDADLTPPQIAADATTRERFAEHGQSPGCAICHELMDPIGFTFLNYDAIGRYRREEVGQTIDASGYITEIEEFPDSFSDAIDMAKSLGTSSTVSECLTRQLFRYALGRPERDEELRSIAQAHEAYVTSPSIPDLFIGVVMSPAFRWQGSALDEEVN